jgi:ribose 5-phosphate isomerase B
MRIVLGGDHRGFALKNRIADHLRSQGHEVIDVGVNSDEPVDYPDIAVAVSRKIQAEEAERGFLVCGSGVGACIAANKLAGIRAAVCHDTYSARQGVEHDDMNLLCMGSRVIGDELALEVANAFVNATFSGEERYRRRLEKVQKLERHAEPVEG